MWKETNITRQSKAKYNEKIITRNIKGESLEIPFRLLGLLSMDGDFRGAVSVHISCAVFTIIGIAENVSLVGNRELQSALHLHLDNGDIFSQFR